MTIDESTMMAPTDRSIPAVRMMIVWPMARVPMTITCWTIREMLLACRKLSATIEKMITDSSSTMAGPRVALVCSTC